MQNLGLNKPVFLLSEVFLRFAITLLFVSAVVLPSSASAQTYTLDLVADTQTPIPGEFNLFNNLSNPVSLDKVESEAFVGSVDPTKGIYTNVGNSIVLVVDESTPIPGGTGNFTDCSAPVSLGGGDVAFLGLGSSGQRGVYTLIAGTLAVAADKNTPVPDGTGSFISFNGLVSSGGGNVAFVGNDSSGQQGVYTFIAGTLAVVADINTPIPGGTGNLTGFFELVSLGGGDFSFQGFGSSGQRGVYTLIAGTLAVAADKNMPVPDGTGSFISFNGLVSIGGGDVAFLGFGSSGQVGIYAFIAGTLAVVADKNTPIPGGTGNFTSVSGPVSSGAGNVAFVGNGSSGQQGVYTFIAGTLAVAADINTPIPGGGTGNFLAFNGPPLSIGVGDVAFRGFGSLGQIGAYTFIAGSLALVADINTPIPGGTGNFASFDNPISLGGGDVAFRGFGSLEQIGIYTSIAGTLDLFVDTNTPIPGGTGNFTDFQIAPVSLGGGNVAFIGFGSLEQIGTSSSIAGTLDLFVDTNTPIPGGNALIDKCSLTIRKETSPAGASGFGFTGEVDDVIVGTFANTEQFNLTVNSAGTGTGTVTSVPPGIDCGADCTELYVANTVVNLNPTPDPGSDFIEWTGDPDCTEGTITMDMDIICTVVFNHNIPPLKTADISVVKSATQDQVEVDAELTYSFAVHNGGPDTAPGVQLKDILPKGVTFVSASESCVNNNGTIICTLRSIPNGGNASVSIVVIPMHAGTITNSATVSSGGAIDPNRGNNASTITTEVVGNATEFLTVVPNSEEITTSPERMFSIPVEISTPNITQTISITQTKQTANRVVFKVEVPEGFDVVVDVVAPEGDGVLKVSFQVSTSTGQPVISNTTVEVMGGGGDGGCSIASSSAGKPEMFGLFAPFMLLPLVVILRRKNRRK